jgi:hypothetical protein
MKHFVYLMLFKLENSVHVTAQLVAKHFNIGGKYVGMFNRWR